MRTPILILNFKNYIEASGEDAVRLARAAYKVAEDLNAQIILAPPTPSLALVAREASLPVIAQHIDLSSPGSTTGTVVPEVVKFCGGKGSLVNHSERRLEPELVKKTSLRLRELDMYSIVCAQTPEEVSTFTSFKPDFVAIEPPELIGSGVAVSKARPDVVTRSVDAAQAIDPEAKVICGAGIVSGEDVEAALNLGAQGILVASGVVKAKDWSKKLTELCGPLKRHV